jgi:hypothetical protein
LRREKSAKNPAAPLFEKVTFLLKHTFLQTAHPAAPLISTAMRGVSAMTLFSAALAATLAIVAARVGGAGSGQAALAAATESRGYGAAAEPPDTCGLLDGEMLFASSSDAVNTKGLVKVGEGAFGEVGPRCRPCLVFRRK